jgi:hypothetical protein
VQSTSDKLEDDSVHAPLLHAMTSLHSYWHWMPSVVHDVPSNGRSSGHTGLQDVVDESAPLSTSVPKRPPHAHEQTRRAIAIFNAIMIRMRAR